MNNNHLMEKSDMNVSASNPLINQISPQKNLRNKVYITYNICETCNLNCLFCCISDKYHGKKFISKDNSDIIIIEGVEKKGLGIAIMNRLLRSCSFNYYEK